jgi:hypothetical protein
MADAIRCYLDAYAEYDSSVRELGHLTAIIQEVSRRLSRDPTMFMFSNVAHGMPAEVAMSPTQNPLDGRTWPSAEQIQTTLAKVHDAKRALSNAWNAVVPSDRGGLKAPPVRTAHGSI